MVQLVLFLHPPITARAFCLAFPFGPRLLTTTLFTRLSTPLAEPGLGICTTLFPTQYLGEVGQVRFSFFVATTSDDGVVPVSDVGAFVDNKCWYQR